MIKLLYLLTGIALKQTIDEIKSLVNEYVNYLARYRESIQQLPPEPGTESSSAKERRAVAEHEHRVKMRSEVVRLTWKIGYVRLVPALIYLLLTIGLVIWIVMLELGAETK